MLLASYAQATIAMERRCAREYIAQVNESMTALPAQLGTRAERLIAFAELRQRRRLDNCLLPALRAACAGSGSVRELEQLAEAGGELLPQVRASLREPAGAPLRVCLSAYCSNLLLRLDCEEWKVLPLARQLLSEQDWFQVGAQFLRQDGQVAGAPH